MKVATFTITFIEMSILLLSKMADLVTYTSSVVFVCGCGLHYCGCTSYCHMTCRPQSVNSLVSKQSIALLPMITSLETRTRTRTRTGTRGGSDVNSQHHAILSRSHTKVSVNVLSHVVSMCPASSGLSLCYDIMSYIISLYSHTLIQFTHPIATPQHSSPLFTQPRPYITGRDEENDTGSDEEYDTGSSTGSGIIRNYYEQ